MITCMNLTSKNVQKYLQLCSENFTSTLKSRKKFSTWSISQSLACSFCLQSDYLQNIVHSCKLYYEHGRYIWRHDTALNFIAKAFSALPGGSLYFDLSAFRYPYLSPVTPFDLTSTWSLKTASYIFLSSLLALKLISKSKVSVKLLKNILCNKLYIQTITKSDFDLPLNWIFLWIFYWCS